MNADSRSVPTNAKEIVQRVFSDANKKVIFRDCDFEPDSEIIKQALIETEDFVTVWGGDGTICWALDAIDHKRAVLALPGGTMNLVHKRIHGDHTDPAHLLHAALQGRLHHLALSGGQANGHTFFVAAMLGHLTKLTEVREGVRKAEPIRTFKAIADGDLTDTEAYLSLHPGDISASAIAAFLFDDDDARFEVGTINPDTLADLLATAMEAGFTDWRDADRVDYRRISEPTIEADLESIPCALDGEPIDLQPPIHIKPLSRSYNVLSARDIL